MYCNLARPTRTLLRIASKRSLASEAVPPLDPRNRVLDKVENNLKSIIQERETEITDVPKKKMALHAGSIISLMGLGLAAHNHSDILLTTDNLSLALVTVGGGLMMFSLKNHDTVKKLFSKDSNDYSDKMSVFSFKLLNGDNLFSKELLDLESTCGVESRKWPVEVQAKLDTLLSQDINKLEEDIKQKQTAMLEHVTQLGDQCSAKEALSSLSPKVYVLDYNDPDPLPKNNRKRQPQSRAELFGEEVSFLLTCSTKYDTVMVNLQSPGGAVSEFGLAASHLLRLKKAGIRTVVTVDKVAASGGFMMACCADEIIAAPFAFLGSIGVVAEIPNINKVLTKNDIDWNMFTAGKFKRTITVFSENTEEGKEKFQTEIDTIHNAFKEHVNQNRGDSLDIEQVATGEAWLAVHCKEYGLVDKLATSLDVMQEYSLKGYDIIKVTRQEPKKDILQSIFKRSLSFTEDIVDRVSEKFWTNFTDPLGSATSVRDDVARMSPQSIASQAKFKD